MDRIARFIVDHSRIVLAATALISVLSVLMLFRMSFNADVSSFLLEGNATGKEFVALQEKYETTDPINVIASLPAGEAFNTSESLALVAELRDTLSAVEGVVAVAAVVPETNPLTGAPLNAETIRAAPDAMVVGLLSQNPMSELLVSEDGQHTMLMVSPGDDPTGTARRVTDVTQDGLKLTFSGNPVVFASVLDLLTWFLLIIPPLVIALLILTFFTTIGDLRLSAMALIPAALGSLWTFGLIFGLGRQVDIVTVIVPIFVIVMGSADGLHFVTHFQEQAATTTDPVERVRSALSEVGVPMILTTVSTAAGFLSLLATDVEPIRQLGLFTAIGITFAGIISFFSLPAAISHITIKDRSGKAILGPSVTAAVKKAVKTRVPAITITLLILAFGVWGIPQLAVNPDQLFFFKDDDPVRLAFEKTEELFGGATPLIGEFAYDPADPEGSIAAAQQATAELEALPSVRTVFSIASLAATLTPDQIREVAAGSIELPIGKMISEDGMRFMLLPSDFATEDLEAWVAYADESDTVVVLTGMPIVWDEIARLVLNAQATSLIVAYVLVVIMLMLAYRSIVETLVSLVPITLTLITLLAFIALSGIQLNLLTAVISSIVLGVGIDYAIHYIAAINYSKPEGKGYVLRAIDKAGRPIIANALGIAVALSALWLSPLKIHSQVSMIMWVAMITAAATTLIVIPALLPRDGVEEPTEVSVPAATSS
ncbi:MAG: efflux RND transporter permease subunit [Acidimicrobiia bacterium]